MDTVTSTLTVSELDAVDRLMKQNSATLGFLPTAALNEYISRGNAIGAWNARNEIVGYLLYGINRNSFRIAHLCVSQMARGQGIARTLLEELKRKATTQKRSHSIAAGISQAHALWPKLGFVPMSEKPGRSKAGYLLTFWCLTIAQNDQLSLFQAASADDTLDVVIDAQIFFDLINQNRNQMEVSKALLSDFLAEAVTLNITDELMVEIDRSNDATQREAARNSALGFPTVVHNIESYLTVESALKNILSTDSPRATL